MSDVIPFTPKTAETEAAPQEAEDDGNVSCATALGESAAECLDEVLIIGSKDGQFHINSSHGRVAQHMYLLAIAQKVLLQS